MISEAWKLYEKQAIENIRERYRTDSNLIRFNEENAALFGEDYKNEKEALLKCNSFAEMQDKHEEFIKGKNEITKIPHRIALVEMHDSIRDEILRIEAVEKYKKRMM